MLYDGCVIAAIPCYMHFTFHFALCGFIWVLFALRLRLIFHIVFQRHARWINEEKNRWTNGLCNGNSSATALFIMDVRWRKRHKMEYVINQIDDCSGRDLEIEIDSQVANEIVIEHRLMPVKFRWYLYQIPYQNYIWLERLQLPSRNCAWADRSHDEKLSKNMKSPVECGTVSNTAKNDGSFDRYFAWECIEWKQNRRASLRSASCALQSYWNNFL